MIFAVDSLPNIVTRPNLSCQVTDRARLVNLLDGAIRHAGCTWANVVCRYDMERGKSYIRIGGQFDPYRIVIMKNADGQTVAMQLQQRRVVRFDDKFTIMKLWCIVIDRFGIVAANIRAERAQAAG